MTGRPRSRALSVAARLREIAEAHGLSAATTAQLGALVDLVAHSRDAPTTVSEPRDIVDIHVADSLAALEVPGLRGAASVADLGAGAGFPGLPLAAALPDARVALVESNGRKCAFLERAATQAGITNAPVVHARAEAWTPGRGACDVVTARALAPLSVLVEYAAPLLQLGGTFVAWKGAVEDSEADRGHRAALLLGLEPLPLLPVTPYAGSRQRTLHPYRKTSPTPAGYPRRPGMAAKRPLGS